MTKRSAQVATQVTCADCTTTTTIAAPSEDAWYGVEPGVERVTWVCDSCGSTQHIDRPIEEQADA